ncbi:MAG TPA: CDP-glycerol glycerophosphotransferase family protein [Mycobacteriales bacterium]|nr:CDP-glycerol glycerophosphotransferase family protein [Mycobacteriales bacterium]
MIAKARSAGLGTPILVGLAAVAVTLVAARNLALAAAVPATVAIAVVVAATAVAQRLRELVVRMRRTPLRSRNLDLGEFRMPRRAPRLMMRPRGLEWLPVAVAATGAAVAGRDGGDALGVAAIVLAALLACVPVAVLARLLWRDHRTRLRERATDAISRAVGRYEPELILYFAGSAEELYQLRMWFAPVERLGLRVLIVVRSDLVMDQLGRPPFPVIGSTYNGLIAALPLPKRVVTLFVTHSGNNLSMVRRRETVCVFVGHGESDKPDSSNPYARLYDEVWVAGPLGRRRYAEAGVGVRDEAIREIGRPQFVAPTQPPDGPAVIVYAPTWEGWGDDEHHSSLAHAGVVLVEALLAVPGVEVRYRPHPLTGQRDLAVRRAHREIVKRVGRVPATEPISRTMAGAAGLVADVSSVIGEYLAYDRPYAVIDTRGLGRRAHSRRFPSSAGAFLLGPDLAGLGAFVDAATGGRDSTASRRRALIADALGDPATAQQRFAAEVARLRRG